MTRRAIALRLLEIERDLKKHYAALDIKVIGTWKHRGNVELYFKHRYKMSNYKIGKLTEYFKFKEISSVVKDLEQMRPKKLTDEELAIFQGAAARPILR